MYMSQQCILGKGKLVMVLVQLTFRNSCIRMITSMQKLQYMILKFILDNQLENARTAKSIFPNFTKWDMDIGKILFAFN